MIQKLATDYSKNENYILKEINEKNEYDLIFFVGTSATFPTLDNGVSENLDEIKAGGIINYNSMGKQLSIVTSSKKNSYTANVIIPSYRQLCLTYELDNAKTHDYIPNDMKIKEPGVDLIAFMDFYFSNINKDGKRPFVIAGHSQGGAATQVVLEKYLLEEDHKKYLKNMVALYSIGYGVSKKQFATFSTKLNGVEMVHLGEGAKDINCVLSWNTEGPNPTGPNFLLADEPYDTYVINPLNWKTDDTYASRDENVGVSIEDPNVPHEGINVPHIMSYEYKDKFDAKIDLKRGCVVCSEPHVGNYVDLPGYPNLWGSKSLHTFDGGAFYCNMSLNLGDRLDVYFKK